MIEFDIRGDGTIVSLTRHEFFQLLANLVVSYVDLAVQYIRLHMVGLADFDNEHLNSNMKIIQHQFRTIRTVISDIEVDEELNTLVSCLQKLDEHDQLIVRAYADYYGLINAHHSIDRKKLKRIVKRSRSQGSLLPEAVRDLSKESEDLRPIIQNLGSSLSRKIEKLQSLEDSEKP
jgi:hypothetical protein